LTSRFVAENADEWPVAWMCEALGVSASGYYARADSPTRPWRDELPEGIEEIHAEVKHRYGRPRMTAELKAREYECSENTAARLMKAHGIRAKAPRRFARTTDSNHRLPVAANLRARGFEPSGPNTSWSAGIAYVPAREGWVYLAVAEDLFSRRVVGWSMAETMESRLAVDAREMAVARRRPGAGLVAHSDRGSPYASDHDQRVLKAAGIMCRMSGVGPCWANAPVESVFGRRRCEIGGTAGERFATRERAKAAIFEYLEVFYNRVRRHSSLGLVSPEEFERTYNRNHRYTPRAPE
jgi:transposase InsO family protein